MAEVREYAQYQCDGCGFRTRSPDTNETIEIAIDHAERQHDSSLSEEAVRGELRMIELEGLPQQP